MSSPESRAAVMALLPHRDPFLFVDRFERESDESLIAHWHVPKDADWFRGHYPGQPVLPGVLTCEHGMQAAAILVALLLGGFQSADGVPVVTRLENARFRRMVAPGDQLITKVKLIERFGPAWRMEASVRADGQRVLDLVCVLSASLALARAADGGVAP
mgnify:CR=1 FL=1